MCQILFLFIPILFTFVFCALPSPREKKLHFLKSLNLISNAVIFSDCFFPTEEAVHVHVNSCSARCTCPELPPSQRTRHTCVSKRLIAPSAVSPSPAVCNLHFAHLG